jgi:hypothetical protein
MQAVRHEVTGVTGSCAGQPSYMNELEAGLEAMLSNSAVAEAHDDWEPTI